MTAPGPEVDLHLHQAALLAYPSVLCLQARRVLKRTTTSLIITCWTGDHGTTPSFIPAVAPIQCSRVSTAFWMPKASLHKTSPTSGPLLPRNRVMTLHVRSSPLPLCFCPVRASPLDEFAAAAALYHTLTQPDLTQPDPAQPDLTQPVTGGEAGGRASDVKSSLCSRAAAVLRLGMSCARMLSASRRLC